MFSIFLFWIWKFNLAVKRSSLENYDAEFVEFVSSLVDIFGMDIIPIPLTRYRIW